MKLTTMYQTYNYYVSNIQMEVIYANTGYMLHKIPSPIVESSKSNTSVWLEMNVKPSHRLQQTSGLSFPFGPLH